MRFVSAKDLPQTYRAGDVEVPAIRNANFVIEPASFVEPGAAASSGLEQRSGL